MNDNTDPVRGFLRHVLATIAYRGGKTIRGVPASFASFIPAGGRNTPLVILTHIGDLMEWSTRLCRGDASWRNTPPEDWDWAAARFHASIAALDQVLASDEKLSAPEEKLFQGPLADALTHVGQLAVLRRQSGCPMKGENYFLADVTPGRVGPEQTAPLREFD